jgi:hypothetical protein
MAQCLIIKHRENFTFSYLSDVIPPFHAIRILILDRKSNVFSWPSYNGTLRLLQSDTQNVHQFNVRQLSVHRPGIHTSFGADNLLAKRH